MSLKISDSGTTLPAANLSEVPAIFRAFVTKELADPGPITADGEWRAFQTPGDVDSTKPGRKAGTVMLSADSLTGAFGSRRPGECAISAVNFDLPAAQRPTPEQTRADESAARQKREEGAQDAADRAAKVWDASGPVPLDNPYFQARGVAAATCRIHPNGTLIVAMRDGTGRLMNIERIKPDGQKAALSGGRTAGLGLWIPSRPTAGDWYAVEGFAKALAVHQATGSPCLCCFSANNMSAALQEHCAGLSGGILAGDNDAAGRAAVTEAQSRWSDLRAVFPPEGTGDWNDVLTRQGVDALKAALHPPRVAGPDPLRREPPDPEPFPMDALGDVLSAAALAMQSIIQAPDALLGQSVLGAASLAVQAHANIIIDGRISPLSLFFLTIAASGERKSATDTVALKPVMDKQRELVAIFREDARLHKADLQAFEKAERDFIKEKVVELSGVRQNREAKKATLDALGDTPQPPLLPNLLAADPTSEGLFKLFEKGQPSLGLFSDEAGLLMGGAAMMKESRLRMIAALSKLWDGRPLDRVRSVDGSTLLFDRRLALHLMAQPLVASELFTDPIFADQGFLSRVLCAWPASTAGHRHYLAADPAQDARIVRYWDCLKSHLNRPYPLRENTRNELTPRNIPLAPAAKAVWIRYVDTIERQLGDGQVLEPVRGFASKAGDHAARIAGVRTLIQNPDAGDIGVEAIEAGICLMDFYLTEALRIQSTGVCDPELSLAAKCLRWLQTAGITAVYPALIYQYGPRPINDADTAHAIIKILEKHRWLVRVQGGGMAGGRMRRELWNVAGEGCQ